MLVLDSLSDPDLLESRFRDLPIDLTGSVVERRSQRVFDELAARNLCCNPSIWLSEEWFNPDGVVGFAIPFYLMHPRLVRLERNIMQEAEGVVEADCLRILRHETGHAVDEAYQLFKTREYRRVFGSPRQPYPTTYSVQPDRRDFVTNLNSWYAQAHPVEDFAETFAVWLTPKRQWRRRYHDWPALNKLEHVDRWMTDLADQRPVLNVRQPVEALKYNDRTLREHYDEKRAFYGVGGTTSFDPALQGIFPSVPSPRLRQRTKPPSASRMLRALRVTLRQEVARPLGVPAYTVDQVLLQLISRARELDLRVTGSPEDLRNALVNLVTRLTIEVIQNGQRLPL